MGIRNLTPVNKNKKQRAYDIKQDKKNCGMRSTFHRKKFN